jgi:D-ribose pyranase
MLQTQLLNSRALSMLARVRHTNRLVIADAMFPSWPDMEEIDLALVAGIPSVPQVLAAVVSAWKPGTIWMAEEFLRHNDAAVVAEFRSALGGRSPQFEPHAAMKARVPGSTGLIRTGEMRIYANVVMESQ